MSDRGTRAPDLSVTVMVRRTPHHVWDAVADPARVTSWSPESHSVSTAEGATGPLPVDAVFSGSNRNGAFRWTTRCVVVESVPGTAFAFDVTFLGLSVARWRYRLQDLDGGTLVEEQWWDTRGVVMKALGIVGTGVADRRTHNERTMRATLDALAADLGEH